MDICTTSQFICSLFYPKTRLRTQHNIICDPETFICNKHVALMEGHIDNNGYLFYAPITHRGMMIISEAMRCASTSGLCDIRILEKEIIYSGFGNNCSPLFMESLPKGVRLKEAIYTFTITKLLRGFNEFKSRMQRLNISHNNLTIENIIIDKNNIWHSIYNYNIEEGYGNDENGYITIEHLINSYGIPPEESTKNPELLHIYSTTYDDDGNTTYPIVESRRRFTSKNGTGFKDRNDNVVIPDIYSWASDFCCNRATVKLKNGKMGIIDRKGRYIIEPKYSSINYSSDDGIIVANDGEQKIVFNYIGEQLK